MTEPTDGIPSPPEGIQVWKNRRNGFTVARCHYTADPDKRSPEWKKKAQAGFPDVRSFAREYEISWSTPAGDPVFPEFDAATMVREFPVLPGARPLRGWDFGHVCPVVLLGQLDVYGRLRIIAECILPGSSLEVLISAAKALVIEHLGEPMACFDAGDPAGEKMTDLGMVKQIMSQHGIMLNAMPSTEATYAALRTRLLDSVVAGTEGRTPKLLIHPRCVTLAEAMGGAFHKGKPPHFNPVQSHPYKDVVDALRYLNQNIQGVGSDFMRTMKQVAQQDCAW